MKEMETDTETADMEELESDREKVVEDESQPEELNRKDEMSPCRPT